MYLKSLIMKGFKSFAAKGELVFEPGTTVIVGPNGSGKSNIVDAFLWVTGEQSARSLRSSKMQDVIFAGSSEKGPMGIAEVSLTFDNSSRIFPVDYNEVAFTRRLYRSGESEYGINGALCRLADVNDLLLHTNMGRDMYSIVGQGRLDGILNSRPEERRILIEEAAGLAKYKRRKEKALRKLAATQRNLVRVSDILTEIRRQLKPLETQARTAREHKKMVDELRSAEAEYIVSELNELIDQQKRLKQEAARVSKKLTAAKQGAAADLSGLASSEKELNELLASSEHLKEKRYVLTTENARIGGQISLLKERGANLKLVGERFIDELSGLSDELATIVKEKKDVVSNMDKLAIEIEKAEREPVGEDVIVLAARLAELRNQETVLLAKIETEEVNLSVSASAQTGKKADWPAGISGYIRDLIEVKPGYEDAVETLLGEKLKAVAGKDVAAAKRLVRAEQAWPPVMIGTLMTAGQEVRPDAEDLTPFTDFVKPKKLSQEVYLALFGQAYLCETMDTVFKYAEKRAVKGFSFVTKNGEALTEGIAAPHTVSADDTVRRERRLADLKDEIKVLSKKQTETGNALAVAENLLEEKTAKTAPLHKEVADKRSRLMALEEREKLLRERLAAAGVDKKKPERKGGFDAVELRQKAERLALIRGLMERLKVQVDQHEALIIARIEKSLSEERRKREKILEIQTGLAAKERDIDLIERDAHREEIAEAQLEPHITALIEQLNAECGLEIETAKKDFPSPRTREDLAGRIRDVRTRIEYMGPVNLIAAEEFEEVQKRQAHLDSQIKDLKRSERSLHKVIGLMDNQMSEKFLEIFNKVNESFQDVFKYMFPDGKAQLLLTDGDDPLTTGVEIEAQPSGRRLKKVSLLSGGESAMTALALLFALFQINPAPFYILDEADVALDDINLQRFVALVKRYKEHAQFLIVTHQRRTMEVADILYGVSMQKDGVSRVLSQKLSEAEENVD